MEVMGIGGSCVDQTIESIVAGAGCSTDRLVRYWWMPYVVMCSIFVLFVSSCLLFIHGVIVTVVSVFGLMLLSGVGLYQ